MAGINNGNQIDGYGAEGPGLVFHYKQGSFREKEDQATRDLATGVSLQKKGLFRALVSTKGNRTMFMVLIMAIAVVLIVSIFARSAEKDSLAGVDFELTAFSFEDQVYVSLSLAGQKKAGKPEADFSVTFNAINTDSAIADTRTLGVHYGAEDKFERITFTDYDIIKIKCIITEQKSLQSVTLSADVQKR